VVHINCGLHDLYLDEKTNQPRHNLETYAENLRTIFRNIRDVTRAKIIFALTTPVDEGRQAASKGYGRVVRRNADIAVYNAKARAVARECDVQVHDLHAAVVKAGAGAMLRNDGVHLSPDGAEEVGGRVAERILATLKSADF
jgi:lysophospholipase L1-like esterase